MTRTAERRQMTVMFVDMVDSTKRLQDCDPEEFFEFILEYQSRVKNCVAKFEGNVARFVGDGALIYFGWPLAGEDGAIRAIRCAGEIIDGVSSLQDPHSTPTSCRVGIATGVVVVGEIVTQFNERQNEIFGEAPHLAERLQGLGEPGNTVICPETFSLANSEFSFRKMSKQQLKGIKSKRAAYVVSGEKNNTSRFVTTRKNQKLATFGRDRDIKKISAAWRNASAGRTQMVWISGEPGIGKSHLVETFQASLDQASTLTQRYQCSRFHAQNPYYPFVKRTEFWAEILPGDSSQIRLDKFRSKFDAPLDENLLGSISAIMGFPVADSKFPNRSEEEEREAICKSVLTLMEISAKSNPALVLIEDLHWADPSTLNLVHFINSNAKHIPTLFLITYRDEIDTPGKGADNYHEIRLAALNQIDTRKMISDVASGHILKPSLLDSIVEKTDGIPLYIDACTRALLDTQNANETDTNFQGKIDVPFSLHDILMERLDKLGDQKYIAQLCSAIGHEFTAALAAEISHRPLEEVQAALDILTNAKILIRQKEVVPNIFSFTHSLIQDVTYQGLLKRNRRQIHLTIAKTLQASHAELVENEPDFIAEHFRAAERYADALKYLLKAARSNLSKFANREALDQADQAIVLIRKLDDQRQKDELELEFQTIKALAGRALSGFAGNATIQAFKRMLELASSNGSAKHHSRAIRGLFTALQVEGKYDDALAMAQRMLEGSQNDMNDRMIAHHMRAIPLIWQGKILQAEDEIKLAIKCAGDAGLGNDGADLHYPPQIKATHAIVKAFLGHCTQVSQLCENAMGRVRGGSNLLETANTYLSVCNAMRIIRHPGALEVAREFEKFVSRQEIPYYSASVSAFVGLAMFEEGEQQKGLAMLKTGWEEFTKTRSRLNQVCYMAELATCNMKVGNILEARSAVENGFKLMEQFGERNFEAELYRINGEIAFADGPGAKQFAAGEIDKAIEISRRQSTRIFELRAALALAKLHAGDEKGAMILSSLQELCSQFGESQHSRDLLEARKFCRQMLSPREKGPIAISAQNLL